MANYMCYKEAIELVESKFENEGESRSKRDLKKYMISIVKRMFNMKGPLFSPGRKKRKCWIKYVKFLNDIMPVYPIMSSVTEMQVEDKESEYREFLANQAEVCIKKNEKKLENLNRTLNLNLIPDFKDDVFFSRSSDEEKVYSLTYKDYEILQNREEVQVDSYDEDLGICDDAEYWHILKAETNNKNMLYCQAKLENTGPLIKRAFRCSPVADLPQSTRDELKYAAGEMIEGQVKKVSINVHFNGQNVFWVCTRTYRYDDELFLLYAPAIYKYIKKEKRRKRIHRQTIVKEEIISKKPVVKREYFLKDSTKLLEEKEKIIEELNKCYTVVSYNSKFKKSKEAETANLKNFVTVNKFATLPVSYSRLHSAKSNCDKELMEKQFKIRASFDAVVSKFKRDKRIKKEISDEGKLLKMTPQECFEVFIPLQSKFTRKELIYNKRKPKILAYNKKPKIITKEYNCIKADALAMSLMNKRVNFFIDSKSLMDISDRKYFTKHETGMTRKQRTAFLKKLKAIEYNSKLNSSLIPIKLS